MAIPVVPASPSQSRGLPAGPPPPSWRARVAARHGTQRTQRTRGAVTSSSRARHGHGTGRHGLPEGPGLGCCWSGCAPRPTEAWRRRQACVASPRRRRGARRGRRRRGGCRGGLRGSGPDGPTRSTEAGPLAGPHAVRRPFPAPHPPRAPTLVLSWLQQQRYLAAHRRTPTAGGWRPPTPDPLGPAYPGLHAPLPPSNDDVTNR